MKVPASPAKQNLILGLGYKLPDFVYQRFLTSLRRCGCGARVMLFALEHDLSEEVRAACAYYQAECSAVNSFPYHFQSYRYQLFADWLSSRDEFDLIFLCDLRDVVFQIDPFSFNFAQDKQIFLFEEDNHIGRCATNSLWIEDAFGKAALQQLSEKPILCSGTTLARRAAMLRYLALMNQLAREAAARPLRRQDGVDQGIHNFMFYSGMLNELKPQVFNNENGPINTLQYAPKILDHQARVLNRLGQISYVAHQLDRFPAEQVRLIGTQRGLPVADLVLASKTFHGQTIPQEEIFSELAKDAPFRT